MIDDEYCLNCKKPTSTIYEKHDGCSIWRCSVCGRQVDFEVDDLDDEEDFSEGRDSWLEDDEL